MGKSKELATITDVGGTFGGDLIIDNGAADGGQLQLKSAGNDNWYIDNSSGYFRIFQDGVERQTIDASGRVTMPYQPAMFITGNWNAYQAADSASRVRFNHVKGGTSDGFNTSTHTFTAPVAGKYFMSVYALIQTGTNWEFQFYKNGTRYTRCYTQGDRTTSGHCIMDMAANDYASVVCTTPIYLHQTDTYSGWTIVKVA